MTLDPLASSEYLPLPSEALRICSAVQAPPRLVAHLVLVHDAAAILVAALHHALPALQFDAELVLFGAATHDIGKAVYMEELSASGDSHERHGPQILQQLGVPAERARFAKTHNNWQESGAISIEDLLVALADKCWKGKRVADLESAAIAHVARDSGLDSWQVFALIDEILQKLAADADRRLAWLAQFPAPMR